MEIKRITIHGKLNSFLSFHREKVKQIPADKSTLYHAPSFNSFDVLETLKTSWGVGSNFGMVWPGRNQIPAGGAVSPPPPVQGKVLGEAPERVSYFRMSDVLLS